MVSESANPSMHALPPPMLPYVHGPSHRCPDVPAPDAVQATDAVPASLDTVPSIRPRMPGYRITQVAQRVWRGCTLQPQEAGGLDVTDHENNTLYDAADVVSDITSTSASTANGRNNSILRLTLHIRAGSTAQEEQSGSGSDTHPDSNIEPRPHRFPKVVPGVRSPATQIHPTQYTMSIRQPQQPEQPQKTLLVAAIGQPALVSLSRPPRPAPSSRCLPGSCSPLSRT
ncbi:hypothetical protein FIBSPDRAFT_1036437 [Athelia psychrophila]|uniref:Uncharacterized protein n=1 Tax=Athelia psychrophila TaxID=1759441 RepID=A0A166VIS6_9AGAM|nr:hypothetical protein FIBSPDRAFT_1036437 [Fibularhizoctonia sp. CBS 109695]